MSTCVAKLNLSIKDVKNSVSSLMGSTTFLKTFIPISMANIIYNRVNYDSFLFAGHKINNIPYKTFSKQVPLKHPLYKVARWIENAMEDLKKKYLKELYLIVRKKESKEVIEHYCFTITYCSEDKSKSNYKWDKVLQSTSNLMTAINVLGEQDKIEDGENIEYVMQLLLNESAPADYTTPKFDRGESFVPINDPTTLLVGKISTGYHKLKVLAKGKHFEVEDTSQCEEILETKSTQQADESTIILNNTSDMAEATTGKKRNHTPSEIEENVGEDDEDKDFQPSSKLKCISNKTVKSSKSNKKDQGKTKNGLEDQKALFKESDNISLDDFSHHSGERISEKLDIVCLCGINCAITNIELIACSVCEKYQHVVCTGVKKIASISAPHTCYFCFVATGKKSSDIRVTNAKTDEARSYMAVLRLVCYYCHTTGDSATTIVDKVPTLSQQVIFNELLRYKILSKKHGRYQTCMDIVKNILNGPLFYKDKDSMELEHTNTLDIE